VNYDILVLGGGPGGYVAAIRAAQLEARARRLVEERELGGTCLNRGCISTKALVESARAFLHGAPRRGVRRRVLRRSARIMRGWASARTKSAPACAEAWNPSSRRARSR